MQPRKISAGITALEKHGSFHHACAMSKSTCPPRLCQNKSTDVKRGTTADTQIWLQQMELVETHIKIPRNDSTKLVITSLCMCWSQGASLCTIWLFSPGRQSASHECYFLKVAQLLMVDTCGDMETMMDPLRNEAITHGSPSKIARSTLQKSQKIWEKTRFFT